MPWTLEEPLYQAAIVSAEGIRSLEWTDPTTGETLQESPSLLAARLLHHLGARSGELTSAGIIDRDALRKLCESIPPGRWTTHGDVAKAIGILGAAQSVAQRWSPPLTGSRAT
jgi:hypothetical protein